MLGAPLLETASSSSSSPSPGMGRGGTAAAAGAFTHKHSMGRGGARSSRTQATMNSSSSPFQKRNEVSSQPLVQPVAPSDGQQDQRAVMMKLVRILEARAKAIEQTSAKLGTNKDGKALRARLKDKIKEATDAIKEGKEKLKQLMSSQVSNNVSLSASERRRRRAQHNKLSKDFEKQCRSMEVTISSALAREKKFIKFARRTVGGSSGDSASGTGDWMVQSGKNHHAFRLRPGVPKQESITPQMMQEVQFREVEIEDRVSLSLFAFCRTQPSLLFFSLRTRKLQKSNKVCAM